ncbi:MAG: aminopeptidase P family protein [Acidobacteriaceae bacterium]|nr:aminopeptidase P family protein [Acidobacteriaceae bacterium]
MDYDGRQARMQQQLSSAGLGAMLVTRLPNIRYLCGFTGSAGALLVSHRNSTFFTDGRYKEQAEKEVQGSRIVVGRKPPLALAADWLANHRNLGLKVLGFEPQHVSVADYSQLSDVLRVQVRLRKAPPLIESARIVKDPDEIGLLRSAISVGEGLFDVALKAIRPGVPETQVAAEMEYAARRAGAEGMSFETIIASGPRSALPHGRASAAEIPRKGFVVCDFGIILAGYCSDMTRTVHVGKLSAEMQRMYDSVREAQEAAIQAVKPGVNAGKIDSAARQVLTKRGFGKYFTHSTGHGVGLEIHEMPRIAARQTEPLLAGMVITIEPGVYIPETGGVRIEDMVLVTDKGCKVLTQTSKELVEI